MVEAAPARIRPFKASTDDKLVRFAIGKAHMEALAVANKRAYFHPLTLAVWVALSSVFIQVMNWWPEERYGFWGYLKSLPAFAVMAVPIMFLVDWLNRPLYEKATQETLRRADVQDLQAYYSRLPASGLWILEYGQTFVGLIAVDADPHNPSKPSSTSGKTATIRHLYVEPPYRGINIQDDLLEHAKRQVLAQTPNAKTTFRAVGLPALPYIQDCLRRHGVAVEERDAA